MPESPNKIQKRIDYLRQIDIIQFGSTINEQINPSCLYEINLEDDMEDYQSFTTNQYGSTYFSTEPQTSYNEEPSRWLPKQDDSPCLESENDTDHDDLLELLKRVNEELETCEKAYDNNYVVTEEMSVEQDLLFNKINEILKPNYFLPHNEYTERVRRSNGFLQRHEKCASFNNDINYVSITGENELDMDEQIHAYGNNFYNSTCLNNESNIIANLEEQFTGASLEYWGDHSINSIEHSLMQSEWNIPFNTV